MLDQFDLHVQNGWGRWPRGVGKAAKGTPADIRPQRLAATVLQAIAGRNDLNTAEVDDIIRGASTQIGKPGGDLGRVVTLDRYCGSGLTAVSFATAQVMSGPQHQGRECL